MKILIVEDEFELNNAISESLKLSGYVVDQAFDGEDGEELAFINEYDLILLDVNLPNMDGFDVLKKIRKYNNEVNIIMLTARGGVYDRVTGLDLGANDYIVKPFYTEELEARIRSLLRRKTVVESSIVEIEDFKFDINNRMAYVNEKIIKLTPKEFAILEYLLLNRGHYITIEEIIEHIWTDELDSFSNTARVHLVSLRRKLKEDLGYDLIINKIGRGYMINEEK
ncbi:MAG: response regulator transcription factor [Firmicutes bacterium]|nr:response regulator transcription factor [Bacillota bacterium]